MTVSHSERRHDNHPPCIEDAPAICFTDETVFVSFQEVNNIAETNREHEEYQHSKNSRGADSSEH